MELQGWSWRQTLSRLLVLGTLVYGVHGQALSCTGITECGSNSLCSNSTCVCNEGYLSISGMNNDCISEEDPNPDCSPYDSNCFYCGRDSTGPCSICTSSYNLVESSQSCVLDCPAGVSLLLAVVGNGNMVVRRVCEDVPGGSSSLPQWAVIVIGVVAGVIVLTVFGVLLGISIYILTKSSTTGQFDVEDSQRGLTDSRAATLRTRRSNSFSYHKQENEKSVEGHKNQAYEEIDGDDETVFKHKLDYLRSQAEIFLKMLNDMRRRLKELPPDAPAATQYRNVMKDVTRLLFLLNKKPSTVEMPPDGLQLLKWSQQILERYLASQGMAPKPWQTNRLSVLGPQEETQF